MKIIQSDLSVVDSDIISSDAHQRLETNTFYPN